MRHLAQNSRKEVVIGFEARIALFQILLCSFLVVAMINEHKSHGSHENDLFPHGLGDQKSNVI